MNKKQLCEEFQDKTFEQDYSMKSSTILNQAKLAEQNNNNQKRSLCHYEIISEDYEDNQKNNQDFYNQESSIPLCMKQYYSNQKQFKNSSHNQNKLKQLRNPGINLEKQMVNVKIKTNLGIEGNNSLSNDSKFMDFQASSYNETIQQRNKYLSLELQKQRIKNLHFEKMLSILIEEGCLQKSKFESISSSYKQKVDDWIQIQAQNRSLKMSNQQLERQNLHLKELIYIANNNYETLQHKLQQTGSQVHTLQFQKEERQKDFHLKLENLKMILKSLMTSLKQQRNPLQNNQLNKLREQQKDCFSSQNCYSFGDQDPNLRQKRQNISSQNKYQPFNPTKSNKPLKLINNGDNLMLKLTNKHHQRQNLYSAQNNEQSLESDCAPSHKTMAIAKLKSPKNATVEQNYRKLFMKTLSTSSQKNKICFDIK